MFAIIKTGGKQYKVAKNDIIKVEKLAGETGSNITLGEVLMLDDDGKFTLGEPTVANASVTAEIVDQTRDKKIIVFKKKRRKNYRRKQGHRQDVTILRVTDILTKAKKAKAPAKAKVAAAKTAENAKAEPAAPKAKAPAKAAPKKAAPKAAATKKAATKKPAAESKETK
ncbi:MAG: 50S ribosomal protein L21 [Sphingomonadales bacterium]